MKKQIFILISVILLVSLLLVGCSNSKQNIKSVENTEIETIKIGKYFGEPYKLTSSYIPILTIENNTKFKLELAISRSIEGIYTTVTTSVSLLLRGAWSPVEQSTHTRVFHQTEIAVLLASI